MKTPFTPPPRNAARTRLLVFGAVQQLGGLRIAVLVDALVVAAPPARIAVVVVVRIEALPGRYAGAQRPTPHGEPCMIIGGFRLNAMNAPFTTSAVW